MPKIYDCFAFFNELDLLEIRLEELHDVVDHFVIVEATRTFQKQPKPLYFQQNKERFEKYSKKIIHVVVDRYPHFFTKFRVPHAWDYDNHQKEFIFEGLKNANPDDIVLISDVDEIPLKGKLQEALTSSQTCVFEHYLCFYYLNNICTHLADGAPSLNKNGLGYWRGSVMIKRKHMKTIKKTRMMRDLSEPHVQVIQNGGWHFSFLGGTDGIIKKIESWTHAEYNNAKYKDRNYIEETIRSGKSIFDPKTTFKVVDIHSGDFDFPLDIKTKSAKYEHLILRP